MSKREDLMQKLAGYRVSAGPMSVALASIFAMCLVSLIEYFKPNGNLPLDAAGCVSTVLLIMDMGTTERLYIMTTLRVCGTIIGVSLGVILSLIEQFIQTSYRNSNQQHRRDLGVHALDWILIVFRVGTLGPIVYGLAVLMRKYPKYASAFLVVAIQCPTGLLAPNVRGSIAAATGGVLGSIAAIISVLFLAKFNSKLLLRDNAKLVLDEVLEITQMAVKTDSMHVVEFELHAESIHKIISLNESAFEIYAQWRWWTFRTCDQNLHVLIKAARPLFYQAYALYWGNVSAYHAAEYNSAILFCDNQAMFEDHFQSSAIDLAASMQNIKVALAELHRTDSPDEIAATLDLVLNEYLEHGLCESQELMNKAFEFNKHTCFSTNAQKWNMTDYLRQLAMISLALIEYIKAIVCVFEKGIEQVAHVGRLEILAEKIDHMRRQDPELLPYIPPLVPPTTNSTPRRIPMASPRIVVNHLFSHTGAQREVTKSLLRHAN